MLFRPTATTLGNAGGVSGIQVVFEDVTAETRRHDRMKAFAAQVVLTQEEERRHIAQELHDGPVQTLIHLCRQIDAITDASGGGIASHGGAQQELKDLRGIVEGTVAELRGIAKGLRPSILDDLGLVASVSQLLADAGKRNSFETSIGVTGDERRLSPAVELALFRISQEALSNIERHADATRVAVGLSSGTGLRLLVRDDGIGIGPTSIGDEPKGSREVAGTPRHGRAGQPDRSDPGDPFKPVGDGTTIDVWVPIAALSVIG